MLRDLAAERVLGTPRVGVPASSVPSTGSQGPGYLYPWLQDHPEYAGALVRGRITTQPSSGVLVADEDTGFVYTPAGDGLLSFAFQPEVDGVAIGAPVPVELNTGPENIEYPFAAVATVVGVQVAPLALDYIPPAAESYPFSVTAVGLGVQVALLAFGYVAPPAETSPLSIAPAAVGVSIGALAFDYAPPAESYDLTIDSVAVGIEVGALAWNYIAPLPGGQWLVTLQQARDHIRSDDTADDADLLLKIMAASAAVVGYLGVKAEPFATVDGEVRPGATVPARVQMATLLMVGHLYRERDGGWEQAVFQQYGYGYSLPIGATALLYPLRKPVMA